MTRAVALLAPLLLAAAARAQAPAWVGHFVAEGGDLELALVPCQGDGVMGVLLRGDAVYDLRATGSGDAAALTGTAQASEGEPLLIALRAGGPDALTLVWDGADVPLRRVRGSAQAGDELAVLLERLAAPGVARGEAAALRALRSLGGAQAKFRDGDLERDGQPDCGTLAELEAARLVPPGFARHGGYAFAASGSAQDPARWAATASPVAAAFGRRHFLTNHSGRVWSSTAPIALGEDCEPPPGATQVWPRPGDLSQACAGRRYLFELTSAGETLQLLYTVADADATTVKYDITALMDMGKGLLPVGPPTAQEWRLPEGAPLEGRREVVTVGGVSFDCVVVESGTTRTWIPMAGDQPTFPPLIKTETDGETTMELIKVE